MNNSGVLPDRRCTATRIPGIGCALHHSAISSTAASMWPCCSHCGSNIGDLLGMRTYWPMRSTMESSQTRSMKIRRFFSSIYQCLMLNTLRAASVLDSAT